MTNSRPRITPQLSDESGASSGTTDGGAGEMSAVDLELAARLFRTGRWNTFSIADYLLTTEATVYNALAKRREVGSW